MKTRLFIVLALVLGAVLGACHGCHTQTNPNTVAPPNGPASVRLYVLSDLGGAIEPCGCQKDMLGGVDHLAAYVTSEKDKASGAIAVAAGPTFFENAKIAPERVEQETWKAEALAGSLKTIGLAGFAPGANDWADGAPELVKLQGLASAPLVAANVSGEGDANAVAVSTKEVSGVKIAIVGVSTPRTSEGAPKGVSIDDAAKALTAAAKKARADGAKIVVGIVAMDRGEAMRTAEVTPELDVLAVGSPLAEGDANTDPKPPRFVGNVLVVQPSNHLTRVAVVDFFLRGDGKFADGSGLENAEAVTELGKQIDDLQKRIANWEKDPAQNKADVDAQKARLEQMRTQLAKAQQPPPAPTGNFLRYSLVEVRKALGEDAGAKAAMASYYKHVNEFNAKKFADRKAPPPEKDGAEYVGVETCKACHAAPYDVWSKTGHHVAYETLSDQSKEFNLDCVSCHVTGYEKPGGSTVTDVAVLKEVQCETCHGPGSKHVAEPTVDELPTKIEVTTCEQCHHPPHTDVFDFKARLEKIVGPGHGKPGAPRANDPPAGWKPPLPRFATTK